MLYSIVEGTEFWRSDVVTASVEILAEKDLSEGAAADLPPSCRSDCCLVVLVACSSRVLVALAMGSTLTLNIA